MIISIDFLGNIERNLPHTGIQGIDMSGNHNNRNNSHRDKSEAEQESLRKNRQEMEEKVEHADNVDHEQYKREVKHKRQPESPDAVNPFTGQGRVGMLKYFTDNKARNQDPKADDIALSHGRGNREGDQPPCKDQVIDRKIDQKNNSKKNQKRCGTHKK